MISVCKCSVQFVLVCITFTRDAKKCDGVRVFSLGKAICNTGIQILIVYHLLQANERATSILRYIIYNVPGRNYKESLAIILRAQQT